MRDRLVVAMNALPVAAAPVTVAAARMTVAAVWLYEGLWCKVLGTHTDQRSIVAGVPGLPATWVPAAVVGIGLLETAVAGWVLSGLRTRSAAMVQTGLLVAFNAGGLAFAGGRIAEPGRMLTQNAVLLTMAWLLTDRRATRTARPGAPA